MNLLVKGVGVWSFSRKELHPKWLFEVVTHQEGIVVCLYGMVDPPPVERRETS